MLSRILFGARPYVKPNYPNSNELINAELLEQQLSEAIKADQLRRGIYNSIEKLPELR